MSTHRYLSPAKINWFLHITARLDNGYHSLQTVFQKIDWYDTIDIKIHDGPQIELSGDMSELPAQDNLIYRAAKALQAHASDAGVSTSHLGATLTLQKNIPTGAGLGGGSSNAATVLNALNQLWQLNLPAETLHCIAITLGADVPFFLGSAAAAFASGIGEELTPMALPACELFLVKPDVHASTQAVYQHPLLVRNHPLLTQSIDQLAQAIPLLDAHSDLANNMQGAAFDVAPEIERVYISLKNAVSSAYVRMSGSGATVFVYVRNEAEKRALQTWQASAPSSWQQRWCRTLTS